MGRKEIFLVSAILISIFFVGLLVHAENNDSQNNISGGDDNEKGNACTTDGDCLQGMEKCKEGFCVLNNSEENETDREHNNETENDDNKICCMLTRTETEDNETKTTTKYAYKNSRECTSNNESAMEIINNSMCKQKVDCDTDNRRERIKCELENRNEIRARVVERYREYHNDSDIYEACQELKNKGLCVAIYAQSQGCYNQEGENRDRCFKRIANFTQAKIGDEVNTSTNMTQARERVRSYMALVLDNLQHRVDRALNAEIITEDEAATLIDKIVEIKRSIIDGATKAEIRTMLQELKDMWRSYIGDNTDA